MSFFTKFKPKMTAPQHRHLLDGTKKIPGYVKGVSPQTGRFVPLFAKLGKINDGNVFTPWTKRTSVTGTSAIDGAGYVGNLFYYLTGDFNTSTDAITFVNRNTPINAENVVYALNTFVIAGNGTGNNNACTSTDGITWTQRDVGGAGAREAITFGNNLFVCAGVSGELSTSTDGITWTARTSGTTSQINALTFGNNLYVYGGVGGVLATSTDAINWTARTSGTTSEIRALEFANGLFVYGGVGGVLATSTNAITWTARTSGTTSQINVIKYFSGMDFWWYGGLSNTLATSTDAITWSSRTSLNPDNNDTVGLGYGINNSVGNFNNMVIRAGGSGHIYSAMVNTYDLTSSFITPSTTQFTYTYLNTTPATYYKIL